MTSLLIEGYTIDEILSFPDEYLSTLVVSGEPIIFTVGSATMLGSFTVQGSRLKVELGHIDGGGEGALPTLWVLVHQYAKNRGLSSVEWIAHAVNCAQPNLKLRRLLERRGFMIEDIPNIGEAYHLIYHLQ